MTKTDLYESILPRAKALVDPDADIIANMANLAALLHETFGFWWTGFYRVMGNELILGPFQGPLACTRIGFGRGVCGTAWQRGETVVVPDVEQFPGHIACSSESRSEIVVPVFGPEASAAAALSGQLRPVTAVLDIDSRSLATFDDIDRRYLEQIVKFL